MKYNRRVALFSLLSLPLASAEPPRPAVTIPPPMPTGAYSNPRPKEEIAQENREEALKDADALVRISQELRDELRKASSYVVPVSSVKRTKEIEKLARRIRIGLALGSGRAK